MLQSIHGDMETDECQPLMAGPPAKKAGAIRVNPTPPTGASMADDISAVDSARYYSVNSLTKNFYATSLAFSLNMGCATCCVTYATSMLGNSLGAVSSGLLFALYAVSSFLLSKPVVTMIGPKNGLICGVIGQTIYIFGFFISAMVCRFVPSVAWTVSVLSSGVGGVAGGLLWTSQGVYFSKHAHLFALSTSQETEKVTTDFSAVFAVVLLTSEMLAKALSSLLFFVFGAWGMHAVVGFFTVAAGVSCIIIARINSLDEAGTWDFSYASVSRDVGAVARLVWVDSRVAMLLPMQMAFGYSAGYVPYYFFGTIATESTGLGTGAVGLLSALVVLSGALAAIPTAYAANLFGKARVITVGALCITAVSWPLFLFTNERLGQPLIMLCLLTCYGVGRGVWEVINKAVLVEFFGQDDATDKVAAAFSAASFANGYASGMGFLIFPYLTRLQMAGLGVLGTLFSLLTYLFSFRLQKRREEILAMNALREEEIDAIRAQGRNSRTTQGQHHQSGKSAREDKCRYDESVGAGHTHTPQQVLATFGHSGFGLIGHRGSAGRDAAAGGGGLDLLGAFSGINVGQSHRVKKKTESPAAASGNRVASHRMSPEAGQQNSSGIASTEAADAQTYNDL